MTLDRELEYVTPLDELQAAAQAAALGRFLAARNAVIDALADMFRAGMTLDDMFDALEIPRGGMRSMLRAMAGRMTPRDMLTMIEAQKGSNEPAGPS